MAVRRKASKKSRRSSSNRRVSRRKAKKAKKSKRVSVIGKKWQVFNGTRAKTVGGLTKKDLMRSKSGKIVSKKLASRGKTMLKKNGLSKWTKAVQQVRKQMGLTGFVAIKKGTSFYTAVRKIYDA